MVRQEASLEEKPDTSSSSDEMVRQSQLKVAIEKALADLPPRCRAIFIMNRYEGMNYQEIADRLHISFHTVKNQMTIALTRLKSHLEEFIRK